MSRYFAREDLHHEDTCGQIPTVISDGDNCGIFSLHPLYLKTRCSDTSYVHGNYTSTRHRFLEGRQQININKARIGLILVSYNGEIRLNKDN